MKVNLLPKTYLVYTIRDAADISKVLYVGRASGYGTPAQILARRFGNHAFVGAGVRVIEELQRTLQANKGAERVYYWQYQVEAAQKGGQLLNPNEPLSRNPMKWRYILAYGSH